MFFFVVKAAVISLKLVVEILFCYQLKLGFKIEIKN